MNKIFYSFALLVVFASILVIFVSSIKTNTMSPNPNAKAIVNSLLPQGWGFFTRSPREDNVHIYRVLDGSLEKVTMPNSNLKDYFGISRGSRKIGMEASSILVQIPDSAWSKADDIINLKIPNEATISLENKNFFYMKPGTYLFIKNQTVPWAWVDKLKRVPYEEVCIKIKG